MAHYKLSPGNERLDASLGLIYRLNLLWQRIEELAANGHYDKWNFYLDRIFCNLLYKEDLEIIKDDNGNIIEVRFNDKDKEIYDYLNKKVLEAIKKVRLARTRKEYSISNENLYRALMLKDIGLKKFMYKLKLYMKDSDSNPSRAMWGG